MPVDGIEEHLRPGWVVCTARVSGDAAATPRARVLDRIQVFHGDLPKTFEVRYDWFDPSKKESAYNVKLTLGRDHLFCLRPDEDVAGRFALAGSSYIRNQPVEYFERAYPDFFASIPVIVRTEAIEDPSARLVAQSRLLDASDELAGYATRALSARWAASELPRDRQVLAEIEERLLPFCCDSARAEGIRHYAIGKLTYLRHAGDPYRGRSPEALAEMAAREPSNALRWRSACSLRWLASERRVEPLDGWISLLDACVQALVRESVDHVCEELARAIAEMGPSGPEALAPLERSNPDKRYLAVAIREHWVLERRVPLDPERFALRR